MPHFYKNKNKPDFGIKFSSSDLGHQNFYCHWHYTCVKFYYSRLTEILKSNRGKYNEKTSKADPTVRWE